jgi:hypothetical protein
MLPEGLLPSSHEPASGPNAENRDHSLTLHFLVYFNIGTGIFESVSSTPQRSGRLWSPFSVPCNGYSWLFPRGKSDGHEAEHSPLFTVQVQNDRDMPPLLHTSSWFST